MNTPSLFTCHLMTISPNIMKSLLMNFGGNDLVYSSVLNYKFNNEFKGEQQI